jgi:hypothetical protein
MVPFDFLQLAPFVRYLLPMSDEADRFRNKAEECRLQAAKAAQSTDQRNGEPK